LFTLPATPTIEWSDEASTKRERRKSGPLSGSQPIVEHPVALSPSECGPILVVDDEADVQVLLTELLRGEGYEVATASDGAEALDYLRAAPRLPCLILLDLVMPNVDGWQFIEERSHEPRFSRIPVVLISGQVAARETARALGLANCIEKPIGVVPVREMLARMRFNVPAFA
jgi:CheY-like chemotaxis protein